MKAANIATTTLTFASIALAEPHPANDQSTIQRFSPSNSTSSFSYMNITFSLPNSEEPGTCTDPTAYTDDADQPPTLLLPSPSHLHLSINYPPSTSACFNLNTTFSRPDVPIASRTGIKYTLHFSPSTFPFPFPTSYHTQISYIQRIGPSFAPPDSEAEASHGPLELITYNAEDCISRVQNDDDGDGEDGLEPWNLWDCTSSRVDCAVLGYAVRSFRVGRVEEERGERGCVSGAEFGNDDGGVSSGGGGIGRWSAWEIGLGLGVWVVWSLW